MAYNNVPESSRDLHPVSRLVGQWFDVHKRDLPWRHTRDPYRIWLSEIILQQTRVVQGMDYYLRFVDAYPQVDDLAAASEDEVLKLWQGLGYYSRARNLHAAAQQVVSWPNRPQVRGWFPSAYADVIQLKGVGPYTAAAISSFAADEAMAVVDGNVYRVLARLFDVATPIDTTQGVKDFQALANGLLPMLSAADPLLSPGHHNQAMMELGALVCTPTSPACNDCPIADHCMALSAGTVDQRPVKQGKVKIRERHLHYYIFKYESTLYVHQRGAGDIWQGLWEFYLEEESESGLLSLPQVTEVTPLLTRRHQLTHQTLWADFKLVELSSPIELGNGYRRVTWDEWQNLAVPKLISDANRPLSAYFCDKNGPLTKIMP